PPRAPDGDPHQPHQPHGQGDERAASDPTPLARTRGTRRRFTLLVFEKVAYPLFDSVHELSQFPEQAKEGLSNPFKKLREPASLFHFVRHASRKAPGVFTLLQNTIERIVELRRLDTLCGGGPGLLFGARGAQRK